MKINDKYEISPFGNTFDSIFSLLTRNDHPPISHHSSSVSEYRNVRIRNEKKQVRIEFLVPGWKKSDLSLLIEDQKLRLVANPSKEKKVFEQADLEQLDTILSACFPILEQLKLKEIVQIYQTEQRLSLRLSSLIDST